MTERMSYIVSERGYVETVNIAVERSPDPVWREDSAIYRTPREDGRWHYSCEPIPGGEVIPPGELEWRPYD